MNKCTALCEVLDQYGAAVTRPSPLNFNDKALTLPLSFRRVRQAQRPGWLPVKGLGRSLEGRTRAGVGTAAGNHTEGADTARKG